MPDITDKITVVANMEDYDLDDLPTPVVSESTDVIPVPLSDTPLTRELAIENMRTLLNWTPDMPEEIKGRFAELLTWLSTEG